MKYDHLIFVQVEDGHIATSARAIDEKTIHSLYAYNMDLIKFPEVNISDPQPTKRTDTDDWQADRALRTMLSLLYVISFLCLLRYDEALRIQFDWIELEDFENSGHDARLKISLPFRKTHQTGGM